ncbi:MAG: phosphoribosyltransferase family protein [Elusimicrobiales bacterium]
MSGTGSGGLRAAAALALDILFPRACLHCKRDLPLSLRRSCGGGTAAARILRRTEETPPAPLCSDCLSRLEPLPELICQSCGIPLPDGGAHCRRCRGWKARRRKCALIRAALVFNPQARSLIHHLKYKGKSSVAEFLSGYMASALERYGELAPFHYLAAVPVSKTRQAERGYNQSLELARALAGRTGLPLLEPALEKPRDTPRQALLDRAARLENLRSAFCAAPGADLRRKTVLLIDDVATTGATLESCAAALKAAGALRVAALAAARE